MQSLQENPELVLRSVNRRLSELLHQEPLPLAEGGAKSMEDPLWVWGIVGGKDVGKTTLINALAGAEVVSPGCEVGEGTVGPAAYLTSGDVAAVEMRLAGLGTTDTALHAGAPEPMRGLVLVDLPDFDSLYEHHIDQVRRIATVLDGIIWVTTPKKIGDLRGLKEIQRVLKARSNFVYVVNKIDWLLAQADGPPQDELDRISAALGRQIAECDPGGGHDRAFLVSAKYRDADGMLEAIARQRSVPEAQVRPDSDGMLAAAAERVLGDFGALKKSLTTAPTAGAAAANKRANLAYQVRRQAEQLMKYYQPGPILTRLERAADPQAMEEIVGRSVHPAYCGQVFQRLNTGRVLFGEWSTVLFKARIAHWPVLGIVAWPLALVGLVLGGLRALLPDPSGGASGDPFRCEGLSLEDRVDAILARLRAELAWVPQRVGIELPAEEGLVQQFRGEATALATEHRAAVIDPLLQKRPTLPGRVLRWVIPLAVLLWFPLVQPVLAIVLGSMYGEIGLDLETVAMLVQALSAGNVLAGLGASLIILAALVAAVYSR
ncbi:MAG: P-loop NTPase family protein, partial [Planctomycetota bacterium]